jgi:hypothetical protein
MQPRVLCSAKKCKCYSFNKGIIILVGILCPFSNFPYYLYINILRNYKWFGTAFDYTQSKSKENEQTNFRVQKN